MIAGTPWPGTARRPAAAVAAVGHQRQVDRPAVGRERTLDDRQVTPLDRVGAEQRLERPQRLARADQQDHARGVAVEPVHDPDIRARPAPRPGEVAAGPLEQRIRLARLASAGSGARPACRRSGCDGPGRDPDPPGRGLGPRPVGIVGERGLRLDLLRRVEAGLARHVHLPAPHRLPPAPAREAESLRDQLVQAHQRDRPIRGPARGDPVMKPIPRMAASRTLLLARFRIPQ